MTDKKNLWGLIYQSFNGKGRDEVDSITYPVARELSNKCDIHGGDVVWTLCYGERFDPNQCNVKDWKGTEYLDAVEKAKQVLADAKEQAQKIKDDAKHALVDRIVDALSQQSAAISDIKEYQSQRQTKSHERKKRAIEFISKYDSLLDEYKDVKDEVRQECKRVKHDDADD